MSEFNNNISFLTDALRFKRLKTAEFKFFTSRFYYKIDISQAIFFDLIKDPNMALIVYRLLTLNLLDIMESSAIAAKNQNIFGSSVVIKNPIFYRGKLNIEIDNRLSEINKYLDGLIKVFFDKIIKIIFPDNNGEDFFDVFCDKTNIS